MYTLLNLHNFVHKNLTHSHRELMEIAILNRKCGKCALRPHGLPLLYAHLCKLRYFKDKNHFKRKHFLIFMTLSVGQKNSQERKEHHWANLHRVFVISHLLFWPAFIWQFFWELRSIYFPNERTFLEHFCHHFWVGSLLLCYCTHPKVMTKMFKKCSTDQRFIRKRNTT